MNLKGIHHVSSLTAQAPENVQFYTETLGLRLIKKTVNQDNPYVYHLFYGDEVGNPGTEFTFFEIPNLAKNHDGNNSISATSLRVAGDKALDYWKERFEQLDIEHAGITRRNGHQSLAFRDFEGQRMILVSDENNRGVEAGTPWSKSPIPEEHAIRGLGPVKLTVPYVDPTAGVLTDIMGFRKGESYPSDVEGQPDIFVYETGDGGNGAEIHIEERRDLKPQREGRGGVHHVAFRVDNEEELNEWIELIDAKGFHHSGFVDRYYFKSLYFREPNGMLFELATDGPGFATDEDPEHLGESLALPPFLEEKRDKIERKLKPLNTK